MPSTIVHVALAAIVALAVLPDRYLDTRAVAVVCGLAILPDLDVFAGFLFDGGHRTLGHTLVTPVALGVVAWLETRRDDSWLRRRLGGRGVAVGGAGLLAVIVASVGLDYVTNGVNLLWPLHDEFFTANGRAIVSNQRGFVQTFLDLSPPDPDPKQTTDNTHYRTGVDPSAGEEPENVERVFPLVTSGWQLLLVGTSLLCTTLKLRAVE